MLQQEDETKEEQSNTWFPEKNEPQFLLNFSGCKHARRLGHKGWPKKPNKNALDFLFNFSGYKHARRLGHNSLERWDP